MDILERDLRSTVRDWAMFEIVGVEVVDLYVAILSIERGTP